MLELSTLVRCQQVLSPEFISSNPVEILRGKLKAAVEKEDFEKAAN
jgi:protein-arginine kinase activator protein McsA